MLHNMKLFSLPKAPVGHPHSSVMATGLVCMDSGSKLTYIDNDLQTFRLKAAGCRAFAVPGGALMRLGNIYMVFFQTPLEKS